MYPNPFIYFKQSLVNANIRLDAGSIHHTFGTGGCLNISGMKPQTSEAPSSAERLKACNVLVVEDESIIAMDEVMMLEDFGLNVLGIARTGNQALTMAESMRPDLILMDVDLGEGLDGIDACRCIRKKMSVKIIFITGHFTEDIRIHEVRQMQNTWMFRKPINPRKLQNLILEVLSESDNEHV